MKASRSQIADLATTIAAQAQSLASRVNLSEPMPEQEARAKALLLQDNVATLVAWTKPEQ